MSNKKSKNNNESDTTDLELREKHGPAPPRPVTIAAAYHGVTSAPNLLSPAVLNQSTTGTKHVSVKTSKPRMPDPEPEHEEDQQLHVNRIHVTSAPVTPAVATNSVYMNVPKHPAEYVNFVDSKHQYVNVPDNETLTSHSLNSKRKIFVYFCTLCHYLNDSYSFIFYLYQKF